MQNLKKYGEASKEYVISLQKLGELERRAGVYDKAFENG